MRDVSAYALWGSNAHMIADVARLGWVTGDVLDLSYGRGNFWTEHRPASLWRNDLDHTKGLDSTEDARNPPAHWHGRFDTVVWDPPYKLGGTPSAALESMNEGYGVHVPRTRDEIMELVTEGSKGAARCVRPGGYLLVKCQNQINSGRYIDQVHAVCDAVASVSSMRLASILHFLHQAMVQQGEQKTPRNNASQLVCFHRPEHDSTAQVPGQRDIFDEVPA